MKDKDNSYTFRCRWFFSDKHKESQKWLKQRQLVQNTTCQECDKKGNIKPNCPSINIKKDGENGNTYK